MSEQAVNELDRAGDRLARDFNSMIADGEDLLHAAANVSGEGFARARAKFEERLSAAKVAVADATRPILDKTAQTAAATNVYVRANPWTAVGIAIAAGALIGYLAGGRRK